MSHRRRVTRLSTGGAPTRQIAINMAPSRWAWPFGLKEPKRRAAPQRGAGPKQTCLLTGGNRLRGSSPLI